MENNINDMDRLTRKIRVGEYLPKNHIAVIHTDTKSEENLTNIFEKLGQYEDLEEQGLIVRLPFTAGETVYHLLPRQNGKYVIAETIADSFFAVLTNFFCRASSL